MAEVTVRNVVKRYGTVQVMHGVSVDIEDGQFVVLVGPSGCGKSTLLRMIAGLEQISGGEISHRRPRGQRRACPRTATSPWCSSPTRSTRTRPSPRTWASRSRSRARRSPRSRPRSSSAAEILDLGHLLDRYPKQLSGGQRQRVAMGRAIVRDPAVFLFDEPLSNLDAKLRVAMRVEIKELHQRLGTTIVYVTHDQIEAMTMADKIVVMRDGRVEQVGAPARSLRQPAEHLRRRLHRLAGDELRQGQGRGRRHLPRRGRRPPAASLVAAEPGRAIVYGIRPEHIDIGEGGVPARVSVLEPTGSETQIFARLGSDPIDAVVKDRIDVKPGDEIPLRIDPRRVHVFDGASGARI